MYPFISTALLGSGTSVCDDGMKQNDDNKDDGYGGWLNTMLKTMTTKKKKQKTMVVALACVEQEQL